MLVLTVQQEEQCGNKKKHVNRQK